MNRARTSDVPPPSTPPNEKGTMVGLLDYLRERVVAKIDGLDEPEVRAAGVDSGTNLLGMIKHLGHVERYVFQGRNTRSWPKTFQPTEDDTVEGLVAEYRDAIEAANTIIEAGALSEPVVENARPLRWCLAHMIEETARHAGQMDILRERIDGATGR